MTLEYPELSAKRLELLREMVPRVGSVLVLYDPNDASPRQGVVAAREAAARLGLRLVQHQTRAREDIARGLEELRSTDALLAVPGGLASGYFEQMIRAAHALRRPTMFHTRSEATREALASYGGSEAGVARPGGPARRQDSQGRAGRRASRGAPDAHRARAQLENCASIGSGHSAAAPAAGRSGDRVDGPTPDI